MKKSVLFLVFILCVSTLQSQNLSYFSNTEKSPRQYRNMGTDGGKKSL